MSQSNGPTTPEELAALIDERIHAVLDKDIWPIIHALTGKMEDAE